MKIIAAMAAGLLATATFAAAPAEAQGRWGYHDRGWNGDRGWRDDRGWRGDRRWQDDRRWRGDRGFRGDRGWRGPRFRTVCRIDRGYYGPVRRCFQVRR